ncbi:MAG: dihydroorotase [Clostridiaceae bacterium]|nr:dihydroorotase [Bacillota bacterium]NLI38501.1 dihydroorotase [Clostridiaceae bacterium]
MKLLIKNGTIITRDRTEVNRDILIEDNKISRIGEGISDAADQIIDAKGLAVLPGLVDAHCHLRDPGYEYKEDIKSGSISAAKGGFTSIACMPNTNPVIDNESIVRTIMEKASHEAVVNVYPIGAITKGLEGNELAEMGSMKAAGIVAVSDDGKPVMQASVMKKALIYAGGFGLTVISHCEDLNIAEGGSMNEGETSTRLGVHGIPSAAEDVMVSREIILSEYTGMPVHIAHVSTKGAVEMIRQAKKRGVLVTAETCPHYFTLTEKACEGYNTNAKMNPPLRTQEDVDAVIQGLKDGTIDIIATDHAPHHFDEKNVEFEMALNGIVGFETALPLALTYLVRPGILNLNQLIDKMSTKPSEILKIDKGDIRAEADADLVLVNLDEEYTIDTNDFLSKSKNSPFGGFKVTGRVKYTLVGGKIVYQDR